MCGKCRNAESQEKNKKKLPLECTLYVMYRYEGLTSVCPCIVSVTVNDDQQDATVLAYLFIYP